MSAEESSCAAELEKEAANELLRSIDELITKAEAEKKERSRTTSDAAFAATAGHISFTNADDPTDVRAARVTTPPIPTAERWPSATKKELRWEELCRKKWIARLEELRKYKRQNGDTNVPAKYQPNLPLGQWVQDQRKQYQKMQRGRPSHMTVERIRALEDLGFVWKLKFRDSRTTERRPSATELRSLEGGQRSRQERWEGRLEELREYKRRKGDANVPYRYQPNRPLGRWVCTQRTQYQKMQKGQPSQLTAERVDELEALDFVWKFQHPSWDDHLKELKEYKRQLFRKVIHQTAHLVHGWGIKEENIRKCSKVGLLS